jgi:hypothetical protein
VEVVKAKESHEGMVQLMSPMHMRNIREKHNNKETVIEVDEIRYHTSTFLVYFSELK